MAGEMLRVVWRPRVALGLTLLLLVVQPSLASATDDAQTALPQSPSLSLSGAATTILAANKFKDVSASTTVETDVLAASEVAAASPNDEVSSNVEVDVSTSVSTDATSASSTSTSPSLTSEAPSLTSDAPSLTSDVSVSTDGSEVNAITSSVSSVSGQPSSPSPTPSDVSYSVTNSVYTVSTNDRASLDDLGMSVVANIDNDLAASVAAAVATGSVDTIDTEDKGGRCPSRLMDPSMCPDDVKDQCSGDEDCSGQSKCCSTGCAKVCVLPMHSACELQRENTLRQGRALGLSENDIMAPSCDGQGDFVEIQCSDPSDYFCYCVDQHTGYEMPGTRARSMQMVNCTAPRACSGYQCRMLCPYGFDLDKEGCPMCECRDPCKDVKCSGDHECSIEEAPCASEPCPPLPTCKQARSLSNLCPLGDPLMIDDREQRPFLCGVDPGKPECPPLYKCNVAKGNDYGLCCPAVDELEKPGQCPMEGETTQDGLLGEEGMRCGASCLHDLQCPSTQKCCISNICGQHCVQPVNLTACLQQRMIAELLIVTEREGMGYVPQCRVEDSMFQARQCSRNGLICWCVDPEGNKLPRTLGAAHEVNCDNLALAAMGRSSGCPGEVMCGGSCEYGFKLDVDGCATCDCEDPCEELTCPENTTCVMREEDNCQGDACSATPMCITNDSDEFFVPSPPLAPPNHCPSGLSPLTELSVVRGCSSAAPCPPNYVCTPPPTVNGVPACCPQTNILEDTKSGQCPFIASPSEELCTSPRCSSDRECLGDDKCCVVAGCGPACVAPIPKQNYTLDHGLLQGPTMCEYLRDLVELEGVSLAIAVPSCDENGAYNQVQCNDLGQCWCVDDFGSEIPGTKASSRELVVCDIVHEALTCGEMLCRLGCDYGFVLDPDTACPLCQCRDPCHGVECGTGSLCQMVDIPCVDGVCPAIPQCVPILQGDSTPSCPSGKPYTLPDTNATLACSPRARALECPQGYSCYAGESSVEGVCCPSPEDSEKAGQCPFLTPMSSGNCDLECSDDAHCLGDAKCCSNGCGTQCQKPIVMTACEHQRALLEHRAREAGVPSDHVYLPQCDSQGAFEPTQCHPATLTCWCVDTQGQEVPGTRVSQPAKPNCQEPLVCPAMNCDLACLHGYQLDESGCPVCSCRDPCEEVSCASPMEECRIVHVACVDEPCPPLPVCLPKLENPCPNGSPLRSNDSLVQCGPEGSTCPSSHKCHLSPLGEYALCCPKPRSVCYDKKDTGFCEGSIKRWFFNPEINRCDTFRYGGCGGNLNNFETEEECLSACPVLSSCEKMREKNIRNHEKNKKITFIPKCNKDTGVWLPEQCLEELGVCWCVSPHGEQVPGSLTRGAPQCQGTARSARKLSLNPAAPTNMICEPGQTVHVCDKNLCENRMCFSHPHAVCRVNPCGGCSAEFVNEFNSPVNCEIGLSECQKDLQKVLNSPSFTNPSISLSGRTFPDSFHGSVPYDVDLYRSADVYHAQQPVVEQDAFESIPSSRMSRKMSFKSDLTVVGDVVAESLNHQRQSRAVLPDMIPDSAFAETSLVDPEDLLPFGSQVFSEYPPKLALDDTFEAVPTEDLVEKPGTCPSPPSDLSLLTCIPQHQCMLDTHCQGAMKCCFNGCGAVCLQPEETPAQSEGMTIQPPVCEADGSYAREQRSGGFTWCVDAKGRPLHHTITRGHVKCGPNGQILEQVSVGPVCPKGIRPRVCKEECVRASCPTHPDAICVADPCNDCRVTHYSSSGEKVHCEARCSQPLARGMCRASFKRFFYNVTADQCQEFIYGGCQGNDNNYGTMEECQSDCQNLDICMQPVESGICSGGEARWYYNKESRKCEPFLYSGCGGNGNNFRSKDACEARCPDLVLCPYWSAASMEPAACSRSEACANETCYGNDEAICITDPCTCKPQFVDDQKRPVTCLPPTIKPKTRLAFTFEEESTSSDTKEVKIDRDSLEFEARINKNENEIIPVNQKDPVTIYLEGEASLTRCQLLQKHLQENNSKKYMAQCDPEGKFLPTQCYTPSNNDAPKCWCVDETGKKTQPTVYFTLGQRECDFVAVESVVVTLGFRGRDAGLKHLGKKNGFEIKNQVHKMLTQMTAETLENEVGVVDLPDLTQVKFTLLGQNKIDVAYELEERVKNGDIALELNEERVPADLRASWFHHQVSEPRWGEAVAIGGGTREVVSSAIQFEPPYLAATVIFTVITAMLVCGLVVALVLYRRHTTGTYPKGPRGSMQSLAFSDTSLDRRSVSSGRLSEQFPSPPRRPTVTTVENEYRYGRH